MVGKRVFQLDVEKSGLLSNKDQIHSSKQGDDVNPGTRKIISLKYPLINIPESRELVEVDIRRTNGNFHIGTW